MGILPFFTFLRSPVYIIIASCVGWFLFQNALSSHAHRFSVFFLFFLIELYGGTIGSIVGENQHRMLTWTLPHFRKRLMIWSIIVGLFSVVSVDDCADLCTPQCVLVNNFVPGQFGLLLFGICLFGGWSLDTNRPGLIYKCRDPHHVTWCWH